MRRIALLIEAANVKGQDRLPGAEADIKNLNRYLTSVNGGAWDEKEIITLKKPSVIDLLTLFKRCEFLSDYMFISFSGHGYMKSPPANSFPPPAETSLTTILLNDTEEITVDKINPCVKNFLLLDSCREFEIAKSARLMEALRGYTEDSSSRSRARQLFDESIEYAGSGQIIAFSCGINKTAGEDPNRGGYFTAAMIDCGSALPRNGTARAITTQEAFNCAIEKVRQLAPQQDPSYRPGRRMVHFPFAVRL